MQLKANGLWLLLIAVAGFFCLLYIWFTLFPGRINPEVFNYFSKQQVYDGRAYSFVPRLLYALSFLAQASFLIRLVFGGRAVAVSRSILQITGRSIWSYLLFFLVLWLLLKLISLPFDLYTGFFWQHHWGFSTQTLGAWWSDYFKSAGLELVLSAAGVAILFGIIGRWPNFWWLITATLVSLWLVLQSLLWPVLVSPLFNKFEPVKDPAITAMVQQLSQKARLPVDQVLVMDASKRTTKANAYFTGLFGTKRIVLYDNLLADYHIEQVRAVVAHEMAHWKRGHIVKGLALGVAANFLIWLVLFLVLQDMVPSARYYPPYTWAVIVLFFLLVSFVGSPLQNYVSRGMEREADRVSVLLTGDVPGAVQLEVNLAVKNHSDVSPPNFIRWFSYSHPPALTRINDIIQEGRKCD
ncbi:M48 family metallopeptidase [Desulfotruncus alcoholivorax]|uniref:M48 family metallopeptidase n=1 Tax=Desulfotruncus alcoholivorax TaxID=265477 RepID=UPI000485FCF8|nr:M48 family metallopeptidase [Desulfotruncus alcoholivorax]